MSEIADPLELLRLAAPDALLRAEPVGADDEVAAGILRRVLSSGTIPAGHAVRRRRRVGIAAVTAILVSAGGVVAAMGILRQQSSDDRSVSCWSDTSNPPSEQIVISNEAGDPVATCQALWDSGRFQRPPATPTRFLACVTSSGIVAVIPSDGATTCGNLLLAQFDPTPNPQAEALRDVEAQLSATVNPTTCLPSGKAEALTRRLLDDHGLSDWTIVVAQPFTATAPCATVGLDPTTSTAYLVPLPPAVTSNT